MKRIIQLVSLILALIVLISAMAITAHAEDFVPSNKPIIYFEIPKDWADKDIPYVACHIGSYYDDRHTLPGSDTVCTKVSDNLYSFDIACRSQYAVDYVKEYNCRVVFYCGNTKTYDTIITGNCFGDTLYCDGTTSSDGSYIAYWKNQDKSVAGPILKINAEGNIEGTAIVPGEKADYVLIDFIKKNLKKAAKANNKTENELLTEVAKELGVSQQELSDILTAKFPENIILLGDADNDTNINIKDATTVQKHIAGIETTINSTAADADQNTDINIKDATAIQKYIANIEVTEPISIALYAPSENSSDNNSSNSTTKYTCDFCHKSVSTIYKHDNKNACSSCYSDFQRSCHRCGIKNVSFKVISGKYYCYSCYLDLVY